MSQCQLRTIPSSLRFALERAPLGPEAMRESGFPRLPRVALLLAALAVALGLTTAGPPTARAASANLWVETSGAGKVVGRGIDCGLGSDDCVEPRDGKVTVWAEPSSAPGWSFAWWEFVWPENPPRCSIAGPECTFDMDGVTVLRAHFTRSGWPRVNLSGLPPQDSVVGPGQHGFAVAIDPPEAGSQVQCRVWPLSESAPSFGACTGSVSATRDGRYRFESVATDKYGSVGPVLRREWEVDAVEPASTITAGPASVRRDRVADAEFRFSSESGARFECRLDTPSWEACAAPRRYSDLAEGDHRFDVRAIDVHGNVESTPERWEWTQEIPPETTLAAGPDEGSQSATAEATFGLLSDDSLARFDCRVDAGSWLACTSPLALRALADGTHRLSVRAVDPRGNVDASPAERTWTVDTTPPETTIVAGPSSGAQTTETSARFEFTSEERTRFECRFDTDAFAPCPGGAPGKALYENLTDVMHRFDVRAIDSVGNVDPSPAGRSWTVVRDADGDGYRLAADCNDANPSIHPGIADIPGNAIDEDCSGGPAPWPRLESRFSGSWRLNPFRLKKLEVVHAVVGSNVTFRCRGRGCPFKRAATAVGKSSASLSVLSTKLKRAHLKPGAVLEVAITKDGHVGLLRRYTVLGATKDPKVEELCLTPGARARERC